MQQPQYEDGSISIKEFLESSSVGYQDPTTSFSSLLSNSIQSFDLEMASFLEKSASPTMSMYQARGGRRSPPPPSLSIIIPQYDPSSFNSQTPSPIAASYLPSPPNGNEDLAPELSAFPSSPLDEFGYILNNMSLQQPYRPVFHDSNDTKSMLYLSQLMQSQFQKTDATDSSLSRFQCPV